MITKPTTIGIIIFVIAVGIGGYFLGKGAGLNQQSAALSKINAINIQNLFYRDIRTAAGGCYRITFEEKEADKPVKIFKGKWNGSECVNLGNALNIMVGPNLPTPGYVQLGTETELQTNVLPGN